MMTYKLKLNVNNTWSAYAIRSEVMRSVNDFTTIDKHKKQLENTTLDKCADFLIKNGVFDDEIDVAVIEMNNRQHNVAEFGTFGSFIATEYEGILH